MTAESAVNLCSAPCPAVLGYLKATFGSSGDELLSADALLESKGRGEAARMFYELLVLKARGFVQLQQEGPFGDIAISKGSRMATVV